MSTQKEDLLKSIRSFISADNNLAIKEAEHQIVIFKAILEKEVALFQEESEKTDEDNSITLTDPKQEEINVDILNAIEEFNKNQQKKKAAKEKSEKENLAAKKKILENFKELVNNKEKLAELAGGIKQIRAEWNIIGDIPQKFQQEIQKEFSRLNETFNYNFNIYKELKENDLKRNFSLKNQVIHQLKELETLKDIGKLRIELKILQNKWEEIGPTFKDHWEEIKKNYWEQVHTIQKRINEHFTTLKANLKENLEAKKELIEKAKQLAETVTEDFRDWEKTTRKFKSLQEEWKKIGPVSKKISDEVWKEFRSYSNDFFDKRKAHQNIEKKNWEEKATQKQGLIDKAKDYVANVKENGNPKLIKELQEEWKKIGHAGKYAEQKLWKKFRTQCDAFFEQKNATRKATIDLENNNLKAKNELLAKFKTQKEIDINNLNSFIDDFQKIGEVPLKLSEKVMQSFEKLINESIEKGSFSNEQVHQLKRAIKSSLLNNSSDPDNVFMNEKSRINKLINSALKETAQLENNLGFFANAKGSKMLEDFQNKIDHQKKQIENWREELKKLREAYRQK
jgi:hypothetical protein